MLNIKVFLKLKNYCIFNKNFPLNCNSDNLPFIALKVSPEGEILYANNYWKTLVNTLNSPPSHTIFDYLPAVETVSTALIFELVIKNKLNRFKSHLDLSGRKILVDWRVSFEYGEIVLWGYDLDHEAFEDTAIDLFQKTIENFTGNKICLWTYHVEQQQFKISENGLIMFGITRDDATTLRQFIARSGIMVDKETIFCGKQHLEKDRKFSFDAKVANQNTQITDIEVFIRSVNHESGLPVLMFGFVHDISERKRIEEKLKEQSIELQIKHTELEKSNKRLTDALQRLEKAKFDLEERERNYRQIFDSTSDAIFLHDCQTFSIIDVNETMLKLYGFDNKEEVIGKNVELLSPGEDEFDRKKAEEYLKKVRETRQKQTVEWIARNKFGKKFWVEVSLEYAEINNRDLILASVCDISGRKKIQSQLEYHTQLLQLILNLSIKFASIAIEDIPQTTEEALRDVVRFMNIDQSILFEFDHAQQLFIKKYEYPKQQKIPAVVPFDAIPSIIKTNFITQTPSIDFLIIDKNSPQDFYANVVKHTGLKTVLLIPLVGKLQYSGLLTFGSIDQSRHWSDDEFSVLKLFASLLINIHLRTVYERSLTQAKEEAEQRETQIRELFNSSPLGVLNIRPDGTIIQLNEAALRILGSPSEEMTKKLNVLTTKPLVDAGFSADFVRCVEQRTIVRNEMPYRSVWGKEVHARYILTPILHKNELVSVLVNIEDFTEINEARKNLINLKEKAEESDRMKSVFLSNMSHEIRTPMNGIVGFAELLNEQGYDVQKRQEFTKIIISNAYHLLDLINDIIDISKIESGDIKPNWGPANINELIMNVFNMMDPIARSKKLPLSFSVALPTDKAVLNIDAIKVRQVLINLINNAIKFTEQGFIEYGYKTKGEFVEFYVKDSGKGIPHNDKKKIFERFHQLDNQPQVSCTGTGLGLSICKAYVEMLGGKIWVQSTLGVGSTFFFTLPYKPSQPLRNIENTGFNMNSQPQWNERKILLAEDDANNQRLITEILESTGVNTICCFTAEEAIDVLRQDVKIDLVLMDLRLPKMGGLEATQEIRKFNPRIPIIAQTAYVFSEELNNTISAGCNDVLIKPMKRAELLKILQKYL